jgi:conjugal transfer pilus assembly protein TraB
MDNEILENFDGKKIFNTKLKKILTAIAGFLGTMLLVIFIFSNGQKEISLDPESTSINLDAGTASLDTDRMWRKNVEDKQQNLDYLLTTKIEDVRGELNKKTNELETKKDLEIKYLKDKLQFIQAELEDKKTSSLDLSVADIMNPAAKITKHSVNLSNNKNSKEYEPLKTADNFIPAGTMIRAATLNGLRASTAVKSMSNPDEIVIELLDYGILPNNFKNNVKDCRVIADAYGDLSSETVKIRSSKLSCIETKTGESIETDLVGMVVGPDGYAGIRGTVVSIDQKYLVNATIFGIMSGLAGVGVKDSTAYNPFTIATGATKPMSGEQKVGNNLLTGASNSLDKLSDYYIEHAERISPVIEIDAGRAVTIAVLKGTYFGNTTLKKAISKQREENIKKTSKREASGLLDNMEIK